MHLSVEWRNLARHYWVAFPRHYWMEVVDELLGDLEGSVSGHQLLASEKSVSVSRMLRPVVWKPWMAQHVVSWKVLQASPPSLHHHWRYLWWWRAPAKAGDKVNLEIYRLVIDLCPANAYTPLEKLYSKHILIASTWGLQVTYCSAASLRNANNWFRTRSPPRMQCLVAFLSLV